MAEATDTWYVRFPDNRIMRAESTQSVRRNIERGVIPPNSYVRRAPWDRWTPVWKIEAFADLAAADENGRARHRRSRTTTAQVAGFQGLFASLPSSLTPARLAYAAWIGLVCAAAILADRSISPLMTGDLHWVWEIGLGMVVAACCAPMIALLMRWTYLEHAELRAVTPREAMQRGGTASSRLWLLMTGIYLLVHWMDWLARQTGMWITAGDAPAWLSEQRDLAMAVYSALLPFAAVSFWLAVASGGLIGALVVAEDCGLLSALGRSIRLATRHGFSLLVHGVVAGSIGLAVAAPLGVMLIAIPAATSGFPVREDVLSISCGILAGVAAAPAISYWAAAYVWLYLHFQYEAEG